MAEKTNSNMLFANFNQDFSCISVGTKKGYSITNCDPFGRVYTKNDGARGIVEMLFCTSLIALVGAADQPSSSPRKLQIVNTKRQSMICELLFPSSILAVKLNRKTLVVVLEVEIYIYDISTMRLLHVIETSPNPLAICALSPSSNPSFLAYPSPTPQTTASTSSTSGAPASSSGSSSQPSPSGDVLIFDTQLLAVTNIVRAHKAPLAHISLNSNGTMLATASEKGTVIRVFSVPAAERLYEFRRGVRGARIHCITFNAVSSLLAVSSATDTVHIFKLKGGGESEKKRSGSGAPSSPGGSVDSQETGKGGAGMEGGYEAYMDGKKKNGVGSSLRRKSLGLTRNIAGTMGGYLPGTLSDMWEPSRDFASLKLPTSGTRCIVALSSNMPHVMVVSSEGFFYSYTIDLENGGECTLNKQYNLLESAEETNDAEANEGETS
ncbi:autophagy-related protein 18 [Ceratobasidium sp. AG-Ba]|nr:autophagy-related protein 18 [Ceratobasidium sp. AG-Ba]QRW10402.1 autophagy-related protein 18 [Ceratobasidium sp. AG-Ba]